MRHTPPVTSESRMTRKTRIMFSDVQAFLGKSDRQVYRNHNKKNLIFQVNNPRNLCNPR